MKLFIRVSLLLVIALMGILSGCTLADPGFTHVTNPGDFDEVKIVDSGGNIITIDETSRALAFITFPHHEVHEGDSFVTDTVDLAMADDALLIFVFKTMPPPKRVHLIVQFSTLVGGDVAIWEGVTWTTGTGGLSSIRNRKRGTSMGNSGLLEDKTATPAFTATGNILEKPAGLNTAAATILHHFFAWGKKERILAGGVRDTEEFILKPDTQYAVVFTADGNNNKAQLILNWYEHTDRD